MEEACKRAVEVAVPPRAGENVPGAGGSGRVSIATEGVV